MSSQYYLQAFEDPIKLKILQLQELILIKSVEFYHNRDIHWLSAPVTTGTISSPMGLGSDSLPVKIELGGRPTYLADSMQFLLEYGCRFFPQGCWYIMPTFRGEPVDERHLKQFFHSEAEIPGKLKDVMQLVDEYVKFLAQSIIDEFNDSNGFISDPQLLHRLIDHKIPRITFDEATQLVSAKGIEYGDSWRNLTKFGEQELIQHFDGPVWVTHFDEMAVPFYQRCEDGKALNADLLMGIGETVGCGERWNNSKEVLAALKRHRVSPKNYEWYVEMKKAKPLQTAGFGMGIERFLLFVLGNTDIRDMQVFRRFNDGGDIV